jgi:sulfite exporter TauE/SafE/copper chaperone CopZ
VTVGEGSIAAGREVGQDAEASTPATTTVTVPVAGMTCRACEQRIERQVRRIPGVVTVTASAVHGRVQVVSRGPIWRKLLEAAIRAAGYEVGRTPWVARDRRIWMVSVAGLGVMLLAVLAFPASGLERLLAGAGDVSSGGLAVALLLGLAAGVSTCLALTGGLVLALSAAFTANHTESAGSGAARLRPTAVFVAGRVAGYAMFGALLGAVGSAFAMPPVLVALIMLLVAILMAIVGTRLTGLSPRIAAWSPTLPTSLGRALGADASQVVRYSDTRAALLGGATFFLPCGFTQAVQVYALSTGSPVSASLTMAMFAIGTAPGLFALGGLPSLMPRAVRADALRVIGVVVLGFAILNATAGLRLLGVGPLIPDSTAAAAPNVTIQDGVQVLRTSQDVDGYAPATAALYAGIPSRWIITSLDPRSCAVFLQVPSLGISVMLHEGDNEIGLPPLDAGTVAYSCSMGMYGGRLEVLPRPADLGSGPGPG